LGQQGLRLRRVTVWVEEKQEELVLVTNHPRLAASTIAAVYKDRWQIESFFKSLKQLLKLKTFVGTSENAVLIQIWTALIAMLLLRWLVAKATYGWSLSNLVAMLRMQLFVHRDLDSWLNNPFEGPPTPATEQLSLALT
jgi:IS4 transposase